MVVAPKIPCIELSGTPYEIGFQHGSALHTQIRSQLSIYRVIFQSLAGLDWPAVLAQASTFDPAMRRLAPDLWTEMEGIAAGVAASVGADEEQVSLLDIVALNARSEIALAGGGSRAVRTDGSAPEVSDGCTSLAWALPDGRQVLAQNWDWTDAVGKNLVIMSIEQPSKPKIWMVTEPGIVGKIGFNSASVGVCLNAIRATAINTELLPIHFFLRVALECTSVSHITETFARLGGPASSQHILVADASGARGLEVSPKGTAEVRPDENGVLVHTNHFVENRLVEEVPWLSNSAGRLARAHALVNQIREEQKEASRDSDKKTDIGAVTPELLRARVFADKEGAPEAICCDIRRPDGRAVGTLFNIVMEFTTGKEPKAEVLFGRPTAGKGTSVYTMPW